MAKKREITIKEMVSALPKGMTQEQLEEALRHGKQALIKAIVNAHIKENQSKEGA